MMVVFISYFQVYKEMSGVVTDRDGGKLANLCCMFYYFDCFVCISTPRLDDARLGNTVGYAYVLFSMHLYCTAGSFVSFHSCFAS